MLTLVKFRPSTGRSPIISTTLRKVAVIDREWQPLPGGESPSLDVEEFWVVDVVRETSPGQAKGCFIVRPVRCAARPRPDGSLDRPLCYLIPGTFQINIVTPGFMLQSVAIVTPNEQDGQAWTLSMDVAKMITSIRNTYALVVNLGGKPWRHVRSSSRVVEPAEGGFYAPEE